MDVPITNGGAYCGWRVQYPMSVRRELLGLLILSQREGRFNFRA